MLTHTHSLYDFQVAKSSSPPWSFSMNRKGLKGTISLSSTTEHTMKRKMKRVRRATISNHNHGCKVKSQPVASASTEQPSPKPKDDQVQVQTKAVISYSGTNKDTKAAFTATTLNYKFSSLAATSTAASNQHKSNQSESATKAISNNFSFPPHTCLKSVLVVLLFVEVESYSCSTGQS